MRRWAILRTGPRRSDADVEPTGGLPGAAHQVTLILRLPRGCGTFQQRARHHTKRHCRSMNNHLETLKPRCGVTRPGPLAARSECSGGASWASQPRFILTCSRPRRTSGPGKRHRLGLASRSGPAFRGQEPRDGTQDSRAASRRGACGQGSGTPTPTLPKGFFPSCLHVPSQKTTLLKCPSPHREQEQPPPGHHRGVTHSRPRVAVHPPHSVRHHWAHSESACGRNTVQKRGSHRFTPSHQPSPPLPSSWFRRDLGAWPAPRPHPRTGFSARMQ